MITNKVKQITVCGHKLPVDKIRDAYFNYLNREAKKASKKPVFTSAIDVKRFFLTDLSNREQEIFAVVFLTNRHRLIKYEHISTGTIDQAMVYPREILKRALQLNAAAVVLAHNHPSGEAIPSNSDRLITRKIRDALDLVDIRLLDHILVAGSKAVSFVELGEAINYRLPLGIE